MADTPLPMTGPGEKTAEPPPVLDVLSDAAKRSVLSVQAYAMLVGRSVGNLFSGPHYTQDIIEQMDIIGAGSLPIVLLCGLFIGGVMVLNTGAEFARFGQTALTGDIVAIALLREIGPTLTALLVTGRCASGIASELGSMQVTEQVDAMRAMGTDPSRKLVTPRVLAAILVLPLLTAMMDLIGLVGGCIASILTLRLGAVEFWTRAINALEFGDLAQGFSKPIFFALILSTVGCYKGLNVRGGTQGVGRATTAAVVVSSVLILVSNLFLTKISLYLSHKIF